MNIPGISNQLLLLNAKQASKLCGCSERTWRSWDSAGHIPQPIRIGRSVYWRPEELREWIEAIQNDTSTTIPGEEGMANIEIALAILESSRRRARVDLPLG